MHAYVVSKLYKSDDPLILVGGILPDSAVTKTIGWAGGLHGLEERNKFHQFVLEKYPDYINLAKGVIGHNVLDDFTHLEYLTKPGYAFQHNKELVKLVSKYYGLPVDNATGKAHNYIESGVDILLLKDQPAFQAQLKAAIKKIDQKQISLILADFFKIDLAETEQNLKAYFDLFTKYDFSKVSNWNLFWQELEVWFKLEDIGQEKRQILLDESINVVLDTHQDFLAYSIIHGRKLLT